MPPGFLEFFAGIGLVHLGLRSTGWRCVYANDISEKKQEMYLQEMPDALNYYHCEDIWKTEMVVEKITEPALLATASFPCIDLSLAGHMKGMKGEHSSTFYGFIKVMERIKDEGQMPSLLMIENVKGLITSNDGSDFNEVCLAASRLGFFLDAFIVDAKHFTPQSRPRLFIIGMREDILLQSTIKDSEDGWWNRIQSRHNGLGTERLMKAMKNLKLPTGWIALDLPHLPPEQRDLATLIDLDDEQEWWSDEAVEKHLGMTSDLHRHQIERMLRLGERRVGTIFRRIRQKRTRAEIRFDGLAGCLRTAKGGSAKQIVIVIDNGEVRMRWMSPIEYARLQGVPNYRINVKRNHALTGFADAVCVPVIEWIDRHVLTPVAIQLGYEMNTQELVVPGDYQVPLVGNA